MTRKKDLNKEYQKALEILEQHLSLKYNQKESELQKIIAAKETEVDGLNTEIETLKNEVEKWEDKIDKLRQVKIILKEKLNFICTYGVNFFYDDSNEEIKFAQIQKYLNNYDKFMGGIWIKNSNEIIFPKSFQNFDEMIEYWQSHLNTEKYGYLKYDKKILESLYFGLQTDQLILLMGNPGTGKTSLVKALAKSFNFADAAIIPVQSNWTDKSDLLGYYNPLEKNYVSTPFLDALINFSRQALQNPEKLFIICLDEMNLAHVEYYFAEFLSILQDENAEITLYSEQLRKDILYELQYSGFKMDGDKIFYEGTPLENLSLLERKYYFELRRLAQMLIIYPAKFKIPKNVKFFGTLNQDETTLDISPKVLDRSYEIRVERFFDEEISVGEETSIHYKPLEDFKTRFTDEKYWNMIIESSGDLKNILPQIQPVHISRRATNKILGDKKILKWIKILSIDKIFDLIISSYVLPKIRIDEENYKIYAKEIENLCTGELSKKIFKHIDSGKDIDFWRR